MPRCERMSADYEFVAGVVLSVAEVWGPVSDVLHEIAETLSQLGGGEAGALVTSPNELRATQRAVEAAMRTARDDPLGLSRRSVGDLEVRVAQLASAHEEAARARMVRTHELREAERSDEAALEALTGCRDELWRVAEKVTVPDGAEADMARLGLQLADLRAGVRASGADGWGRCGRAVPPRPMTS